MAAFSRLSPCSLYRFGMIAFFVLPVGYAFHVLSEPRIQSSLQDAHVSIRKPSALEPALEEECLSPSGSSPLTVSQTGPFRYELDLKGMDIRDAACGQRGYQSVPALKDGQVIGLKLLSIRPDSVLLQLGLRDQDVIRCINSIPMDSPEGALEVYVQVRGTTSRFEVELDRGGKMLRHTYFLKK
ncbi:hypothetical protein SAMN05444354_107117 [Stigmatella aurantiaca]|uniref:PDZ domain-containing protein n=1 Tax=Stigmatella aurantiaca TaxID=41 RepID=A0A1H7RQU0_STIAU|nr:hypothetical protein [Stigmatella aurantiaca]SEL61757.1 hypothetical protein SAMN05444354_107117 [Stigmatella aurantiaca]